MFVVKFEGIKVFAPVGIYEQEAIIKNELSIDVTIATQQAEIGQLPYFDYSIINDIVVGCCQKSTPLLEDILKNIVLELKQQWSDILVNVAITKLHPPISNCRGKASVSWIEY